MLSASPLWRVTSIGMDAESAFVTSTLDFGKYPELVENWPFDHGYEMTCRLSGGELEIGIAISNRSARQMPVAIGFHPYFVLPGVPRDEAIAHIPARKHVETDDRLIPTGEMTANNLPGRIPPTSTGWTMALPILSSTPKSAATFYVEGDGKRIEVIFGRKYRAAIAYAPPGQDYICFEPMAAITMGSIWHMKASTQSCNPLIRALNGERAFGVRTSGITARQEP